MEWVACVGVDWGDKEHAFTIQAPEGAKTRGTTSSSPEQVHAWVRKLRQQFPNGTIVVGFEQGSWSLLYALSTYDYLALVPINPRASKAYRESLRLSGASSDAADADLICEFVIKHLPSLRVWQPDDPLTRKIRLLAENRRALVDQRTGLSHALAATLKEYFPQALQWFGGEKSPMLRAFIARWPTLAELDQASVDDITGVMRALRMKKISIKTTALLEKIRSAVPLTNDVVILEARSMYARSLVAIIDPLDLEIAKLDRAIAAAWEVHPNCAIFDSLPGAGSVFSPRLGVAFGLDRSRYENADDVQRYSGIAPVIEASGKQRWTHARWGFPTFLHQTFHEFAQASIPHSAWAKAVYQEQREHGAGHHQAIRTLAFRWIRILFRLWQNGEQYDEQRHLENLRERQSPIVRRLAA